jgi:hypothetical protein
MNKETNIAKFHALRRKIGITPCKRGAARGNRNTLLTSNSVGLQPVYFALSGIETWCALLFPKALPWAKLYKAFSLTLP